MPMRVPEDPKRRVLRECIDPKLCILYRPKVAEYMQANDEARRMLILQHAQFHRKPDHQRVAMAEPMRMAHIIAEAIPPPSASVGACCPFL